VGAEDVREPLHVLGVFRQEGRKDPLQVAVHQAPLGQAVAVGNLFLLPRKDETRGGEQASLLAETPLLVYAFLHALPQLLLVGLLQPVGVDGQLPAEVVQQGGEDLPPPGGVEVREGFELSPGLPVGAQLLEPQVSEPQKAALFQVGLHEPPTPAHVLVNAVLDEVGEDLHNLASPGGVGKEILAGGDLPEGKLQGLYHLGRHLVVAQGASFTHRPVYGGPEEPSADEVVEMTGLQAGVLPVVGEAEDLAGSLLDVAHGRLLQRREGQDGGGAAPPLAGEAGELAELAVLAGVEDPAVQAEAEGVGLEPGLDGVIDKVLGIITIWIDPRGPWHIFPVIPLDLSVVLEPFPGKIFRSPLHVASLRRYEKVSPFLGLAVSVEKLGLVAQGLETAGLRVVRHLVVLHTADPAELEGKEGERFPFPAGVGVPFHVQEALGRMLQGGENTVPLGYELVQLEREQGFTLRVPKGRSLQENPAQGLLAGLLVQPRKVREPRSALLQAERGAAPEPPFFLLLEAEVVLHP